MCVVSSGSWLLIAVGVRYWVVMGDGGRWIMMVGEVTGGPRWSLSNGWCGWHWTVDSCENVDGGDRGDNGTNRRLLLISFL